MGRGVRLPDLEKGPIPRTQSEIVRLVDVLEHQAIGPTEQQLISEAQAHGVFGWAVSGPGHCRELSSGAAKEVPLSQLPVSVVLEAWCAERLDFDQLTTALAAVGPAVSPEAARAFPELLELP